MREAESTRGSTPAGVVELLESLERVAVTTHVGADGDAIGSAAALLYLARSLGAEEAVFSHREPVPGYLSWLLPDEPLTECPPGYDLLVVDTSRPDRAGATSEEGVVRLNLDHHVDNPFYGEVNLVDPAAAASAHIVARLYEEARVPLERRPAEAIYTGVLTDTGGFRFRNVSPAAHELVADLLRAGVVPAEVDDRINRTGTLGQLNIVGVSMANAERFGDALISTVDDADYERTGASELESKESIDRLRTVAGVEVVGHLREVEGGTKASLRSESVDVGAIARLFGGGGHRLAAGYTTPKRPEAAKGELLEALSSIVDLGDGGARPGGASGKAGGA